MEDVMKDDRFAKIAKDPRFHRIPKKERKVKIDKRFKSMFEDKRFKLKYTVDKRGRPIHTTTNSNLQKFYDLSDSDSETESSNKKSPTKNQIENVKKSLVKKQAKKSASNKKIEVESDSSDKDDDEDDDDDVNSKDDGEVSKEDGEVSKDDGEVSEEDGEVSEEDGEVSEDDGEISKEDGEVSEDDGEVTKEDGEVSEEDGEVSKDEGEVSEDDGEISEADEEQSSDEVIAGLSGPDLARGKGVQSSSDEDEEFQYDADDQFDHNWGELHKNVSNIEEATCRLALCNMDWDRIKAKDIMVLLNSFKPTVGVIHSVTVYPSEFGIERMKEEELNGPKELTEEVQDIKVDEETPEGQVYHREKLRKYQLNRLKYYYAIIECDGALTAEHIYRECDGIEYEASATRLDLRYVPDDMTFDEKPTSQIKDIPDLQSYKPSIFVTSALNQSKVNLTWDETSHERLSITMKKKFTDEELNDANLNAYLASSSDEEIDGESDDTKTEGAETEENQIQKYKDLLKEIDKNKKPDKEMELEITWEPGLKETTEELVKKREDKKEMTPWEQYLKKKREKKKQKKQIKKNDTEENMPEEGDMVAAFSDDDLPSDVDLNDPFFKDELEKDKKKEKSNKVHKLSKKKSGKTETVKYSDQAALSLLTMDDDDEREHFSLKQILKSEKTERKKKKKKLAVIEATKEKKDTFQVNVNDDRFKAMYSSHHYNIDPSVPEFKKTKAMNDIMTEKQRRRTTEEKTKKKRPNELEPAPKRKKFNNNSLEPKHSDSIDSLVKSVKMKTQRFQKKK